MTIEGQASPPFSFTDYSAAHLVLQNLEVVYTDIIENDGLQLKTLMNDLLTQKTEGGKDLIPLSREALVQRGKGDLDEIEALMVRVQEARNRKDKRRLLAEYNQRQELIYGRARTLQATRQGEAALALRRNSEAALDLSKVFNPATRSYIDRDLHERCMAPETASANPAKNQRKRTQVLSRQQKLHSVNVYERTQRFEFKVNLENERQRQLFREEMARRSAFKEANLHVIEAIEEGKRVAAYFETEDQAKQFVARLAELKEGERKGYGFDQIEAHSKLQVSPGHKVIPSRAELSQRISQGLTPTKMLAGSMQPLLEGASDTKILPSEGLTRVPDKASDDSFLVTKAVPLDNTPEKAQTSQKKRLLKGVDDRYIAENYYQSANMDELLYEKDGTISKMRQFDYKVHRYRPLRRDHSK